MIETWRGWTGPVAAIAGRELASYAATPVAGLFLSVFLLLQGVLTFNLGDFFARDQADLSAFFAVLPWVLLLLVPALTMRLWAEERRAGTIELLLTLPVTPLQAVLGKFLAGWAVCAVALLLTAPFVLTVNLLGSPDNGAILAGYLGALLLAASFVAIGCAASATSRSQVVAFVVSLAVCLLLLAAATPLVDDFLSVQTPALAAFGRRLSIAARFDDFARGELQLRDALYFASVVGLSLFANAVILAQRLAP